MSIDINAYLQQLTEMWVIANSDSLGEIPILCGEIQELATCAESAGQIDRGLLCRLRLLSDKAEKRITDCVAIQTRTGAYSTRGSLELAPRVATSGWEG